MAHNKTITAAYKRMLGETIYRLRKEKRLSKSELGKMAGVSGGTVKKWEQHKECPDIRLVPLLDRILGTDGIDGDIFLYYYDFVLGG